jgi:hypothetical protein
MSSYPPRDYYHSSGGRPDPESLPPIRSVLGDQLDLPVARSDYPSPYDLGSVQMAFLTSRGGVQDYRASARPCSSKVSCRPLTVTEDLLDNLASRAHFTQNIEAPTMKLKSLGEPRIRSHLPPSFRADDILAHRRRLMRTSSKLQLPLVKNRVRQPRHLQLPNHRIETYTGNMTVLGKVAISDSNDK